MSKVSGSYESVVRGVSEQVAQDRLSGQHAEQVNCVSDPVVGLSRRHGSVTLAETTLPHTFANVLANTAGHRAFTLPISGVTYDLLYRTGNRAVAEANQDTLFCYDRTNGVFIPVSIHATPATAALASGGVSAITQVGRFALMGGNTYLTTWSAVPLFDAPSNQQRLALWVRGGAYSRTFSMTLTKLADGQKIKFSYKTKSASYPTLLNTTSILTSDPDYQKKINDAVAAYNSAVTAWIGTAAEDITPENIAQKIADAYTAGGWGAITRVGSTLLINSSVWSDIVADDGGDNSLATGVGNEVDSVEDMCPVHYVDKVVKVRPSRTNPETAFYLRAYAKNDSSGGITEVTWKEGCASTNTPTRLFVIATVYAGTLYVSDDPVWLESMIGPSADDIPAYASSTVGDDLTNPLPNFLGRSIDYLGLFQDRLLVGSGPVISASRPGDYFNFFRQSALTVPDNDPVEIFSLGAEEDFIKFSTPFNRDLLLYGRKGQYALSGRQVFSPRTAGIIAVPVSKYDNSVDAAPVASGRFAFYAKKRGPLDDLVTSLHQMQPAALSDNPDSDDISQQLDTYLKGTAVELVTVTKPNTVILRTDASRNGLYIYNYLDKSGSGERVLDAWHRWEWSPLLGHAVAISTNAEGHLLVFMVRQGSGGSSWLACERFTLSGALSTKPYMDGLRLYSAPGSLAGLTATALGVAYGAGANAFEGALLSAVLAQVPPPTMAGAYLGVLSDSSLTPTNPYPKDRNGRAITFGRFTLGPIKLSVTDTGGCVITATRFGSSEVIADFNGLVVGSPTAILGTQPLATTTISGYVGAEVREGSYTVTSKRWLPLTVTAIEWAGQLFNHERRA